jgi:flagellin
MAQVINTNVQSLNAQRNLTTSQHSLSVSLQRLSSGLRVNSAKDDAAGLAIADRMFAQVRGLTVAQRNASDGISLAQTAEGAIGKIGDALQRMRELAVQAKNGTNNEKDRVNLDNEFQLLGDEIVRLVGTAGADPAQGTTFNGTSLLNANTEFKFQVGSGNAVTDTVSVTAVDLTASSTAVAALLLTGADATNAEAAITALDTAIDTATSARATWGAAQNRFESVISNLQVSTENITAARSRIMDADFAIETANMTRASILQQAGTAMLAQANALPNNVLTLLRG